MRKYCVAYAEVKSTHLFFITAQQGPFHEMKITRLDVSIPAQASECAVKHRWGTSQFPEHDITG